MDATLSTPRQHHRQMPPQCPAAPKATREQRKLQSARRQSAEFPTSFPIRTLMY